MADSQARRIRDYVQTLERDDRYIVMLYYADGLTPMEISRVLDLPTSNVRNRLQEIQAQLASLAQAKPRPKAVYPTPQGPSATTAYA